MTDGGQSQIIALIQDLRQDMSKRLDTMEANFGKLPDNYPTRREFEAMGEQQRAMAAKQDRFEEWRAAMIEKQYSTLLGVATRADDEATDARREGTRAERRADERALKSAEGANARQFTINLYTIGWAISILIGLVALFHNASITFH